MNDVLDDLVNDLNDNQYDSNDYNISSQDMKKNAKILELVKKSPKQNGSKIGNNGRNILLNMPSMINLDHQRNSVM